MTPSPAAVLPVLPAVSANRGAAYDVVLLAHVAVAVVGFGAVAVAGVFAVLLARSGPGRESVRRYYRPGVNWAGRVVFAVPVLGAALVAMSHGAWSYQDGWITIGLALWAAAAVAGEMALWPAERRLQELVDGGGWDPARHRGTALRVAALAAGLVAVFVVATVVMVAKP